MLESVEVTTQAEEAETEEPKGYPVAFISAVWDTGHAALTDWLKANAPQEVQDLHESLGVLAINMTGVEEVPDSKGVQETILEIAQGVQALGGRWHSPAGII